MTALMAINLLLACLASAEIDSSENHSALIYSLVTKTELITVTPHCAVTIDVSGACRQRRGVLDQAIIYTGDQPTDRYTHIVSIFTYIHSY